MSDGSAPGVAPPPMSLLEMMTGYWVSQALYIGNWALQTFSLMGHNLFGYWAEKRISRRFRIATSAES